MWRVLESNPSRISSASGRPASQANGRGSQIYFLQSRFRQNKKTHTTQRAMFFLRTSRLVFHFAGLKQQALHSSVTSRTVKAKGYVATRTAAPRRMQNVLLPAHALHTRLDQLRTKQLLEYG